MNLKDKISEKYCVADVVRSQTATQMNYTEQFTPDQSVIDSASLLCKMILDKIPFGFSISSFFRCDRLNKRIGGSSTSDHRLGRSADLDTQNNANNAEIFNWIKANCVFDQLIWEYGNDQDPDWVHVSYRKVGNRHEVLRAVREGGRVKYLKIK